MAPACSAASPAGGWLPNSWRGWEDLDSHLSHTWSLCVDHVYSGVYVGSAWSASALEGRVSIKTHSDIRNAIDKSTFRKVNKTPTTV